MIDVVIVGHDKLGNDVENITIEGYPSIKDAFNDATGDFIIPMYHTTCWYVTGVVVLHNSQEIVGLIWADREQGKIRGRQFA